MKYYFRYSDDNITILNFDDEHEASWYAHNEGDHLMEWGELSKVRVIYKKEYGEENDK